MNYDELIVKRRSVRSYAADKKVSREQIEEIVKAAQMAPTWKNSQTGRYYVLLSDDIKKELSKNALPEYNQKNSENAALIVTTFVKEQSGFINGEPSNELGDMWGAYDLGLQNAYMLLKASDMGLDSLIMGLRYEEEIKKIIEIPEDEVVFSVIAVGYRAKDPSFVARKDLDEILKIF